MVKRTFIKEKATYVLGPRPSKKKKKKKSTSICADNHASERGAEGEEGEWISVGVSGSPE